MTYNDPPDPEVSARHIVEMSGSAGGRQLAQLHIADVMSSAVRSTTTYSALPGLTPRILAQHRWDVELMDPNACLARIRAIVAVFNTTDSGTLDLAHELADYVESLDTWVSHKGFLPRAWEGRP